MPPEDEVWRLSLSNPRLSCALSLSAGGAEGGPVQVRASLTSDDPRVRRLLLELGPILAQGAVVLAALLEPHLDDLTP